jgi:hypothetical protein
VDGSGRLLSSPGSSGIGGGEAVSVSGMVSEFSAVERSVPGGAVAGTSAGSIVGSGIWEVWGEVCEVEGDRCEVEFGSGGNDSV